MPAAAAPAWQGPVPLSARDTEAVAPSAGVDARGSGVVLWQQGTATQLWAAQASSHPVGGEWTAPTVVSAPDDGDPEVPAASALTPDVAVAPDGSAVAAWRYRDAGGYVVESASRAADGTWGSPQVLSRAARRMDGPAVAVDGAGGAVAVWVRQGPETMSIQASARPAGGVWGPPVTISAPDAVEVADPVVVARPGGVTAAWSWRGGPGALWRVQSARSAVPGAAWSAPADLSAPSAAPPLPDLAQGADGTAVAVWGPAGGGAVRAALRAPDGAWGSPEAVSDPEALDGRPRIALLADGRPVVAASEAVAVDRAVIRVLVRGAQGGWSTGATPGAPDEFAQDALVGTDAAGGAVIAWTGCPQKGDCGSRSAVMGPDGVWREVPVPGAPMTAEDLAVAPGGDAVLAGVRAPADGGPGYVAATGLDAAGPLLDGLSIPATAVTGQAVRFAVAPVDAWSALAGPPVWDFSDGAPPQAGPVAERVFTTPGPTRVRVLVRDALGNVTGRAGVVTVTDPPAAATAARAVVTVGGGAVLTRRVGDPRVGFIRAVCTPVRGRDGCRVTITFRLTRATRVRVTVGLGSERPVYRRTIRARAGVTRLVLPLRLGGRTARAGDRLVVRIGRPAG